MPLSPGQVLGSYRILEELGRGERARVFAAEPLDRSRSRRIPLAMKVFHEMPSETELRLQDASRWSATLEDGPYLRVFDRLVFDGSACLVLDRKDGPSLAQVLAEQAKGRLEPAAALRVLRSASETVAGYLRLAESHGPPAPILHGALGLDTLFLGADGKIFLSGLEQHGGPARSLEHLAPEQVIRGAPHAASDVFALGSILYRLLTGRSRLPEGTIDERRRFALDPELRLPTDLGLEISAGLESLLRASLAPDARDRFSTVGLFEEALLALAEFPSSADESLPEFYATGDSLAMWSAPQFGGRTQSVSITADEVTEAAGAPPAPLERTAPFLAQVSKPALAVAARVPVSVVVSIVSAVFVLSMLFVVVEGRESSAVRLAPAPPTPTPPARTVPIAQNAPTVAPQPVPVPDPDPEPVPEAPKPSPPPPDVVRRPRARARPVPPLAPPPPAAEKPTPEVPPTPSPSKAQERLRKLSKRAMALGSSGAAEALLGRIVMEMSSKADEATRDARVDALERELEGLERDGVIK